MRRKNLVVFGILNAVCLYLVYPAFEVLETLNDFFGIAFLIAFLVMCGLYIFINIIIYNTLIKCTNETSLRDWGLIILGSFIGGVGTVGLLLFISAFFEFKKYVYINCVIPFHIDYISDLKWLLFVILFNTFLYELCRKIYMYIQKKRW